MCLAPEEKFSQTSNNLPGQYELTTMAVCAVLMVFCLNSGMVGFACAALGVT